MKVQKKKNERKNRIKGKKVKKKMFFYLFHLSTEMKANKYRKE